MEFRRMAGIAGIAMVVLMVGSFVAFGEPPSASASADDIAKYVADSDGFLIGNALTALGVALMLPFVAGFSAPFLASDRDHGEGFGTLIAGSLFVSAAGIGIAAAGFAALGLRIEQFEGGSVRALWDGGNAIYGFSMLMLLPAAGGAAMGIMKHGLLPRWFGYLSVVVALLGLTAIPGFLTDGEGGTAVLGGFLGLLVWILVASILMMRARPA